MNQSSWQWLVRSLCLVWLTSATGCATWRLQITLHGDAEANSGRPLTVLVRSLPLPQYRSESYSDVAQLALQPDQTVVRALTIEPREHFKKRLWLNVPSKTPLAIYFLYTSQTGSWKMILQPPLPWSLRIPLGRRGVVVDDVSECRFLRDL